MNLKIRSGVVSFRAAWEATVELVNIHMGLFVIPQNPLLPVAVSATRVRALVFLDRTFLMSSQVVLQVLWHFERFIAPRMSAYVVPDLKVRFEMLLLLRVLRKHFWTIHDGAVYVIAALLGMVVDNLILLV